MSATVNLPDTIAAELDAGADLAVSVSGGKDSHAMLSALIRLHGEREWTGTIFAIHADLGRMEWTETSDFVAELAARYDVPLTIVRRTKGDLVDRMEDRLQQLQGTEKPFWPSSSTRYCTSDLKRDPIDKHLRTLTHVVVAIGIRREESTARAKKPDCAPRSRITTNSRSAFDWHPLIDWTEEDVWNEIGYTLADVNERRQQYLQAETWRAFDGWTAHPAYVIGNERLSCALCILASRNDLENGAHRHPELLETLVDMEERSGFSFKKGFSLTELASYAGHFGRVA